MTINKRADGSSKQNSEVEFKDVTQKLQRSLAWEAPRGLVGI